MSESIIAFYEWARLNGYSAPETRRKRFYARPFNHVTTDKEIYIFDSNDVFGDHDPAVIVKSVETAKIILRALNTRKNDYPNI